ncbi:MAG TPA: pantetheine-phosphate adenylyltransferase [Acidobacteriota bacterium]|nr:pantetheine-phosphate adenylyltransferase [Acidobacteriota bacterium]HQO20658.1 pantetheine-phosphate adenylyltransferase [Acidobacteriota bacterium]HQQ47528.1 pantetheine-phosphate adenylyltransferase [Acidobacteriota bacterium]
MNSIAIYPGSFDPPTNGHLDLIIRSRKLFKKVVVAVLRNTSKNSLLSIDERVKLLRECTKDLPGVEVDAFDGLLVDYARVRKSSHIIRGIRALTDFEYEFQIALLNRRLAPDIETIFLMPREEHVFLSSRHVREVALLGGPLEKFVPPPVAAYLAGKVRELNRSYKPEG